MARYLCYSQKKKTSLQFSNTEFQSLGTSIMCSSYESFISVPCLNCAFLSSVDTGDCFFANCIIFLSSAQAGPITCGRPILRGRIPAFCNVHLQKVNRALKKAGLHSSSSSKLAPKFHVIVAEYVRQIQASRRVALRANTKNVVVKRESCNWEAPCSSLQTWSSVHNNQLYLSKCNL